MLAPLAAPAHDRQVLASPAVRARAKDLGVDLGQIHAEGDRAHPNEEVAPGHTIIRQGTAALFEAFDAQDGTVYLVRPDTIVAGRWRRRSIEQLARDIEATAHARQGASHG